MKGISKKIGLVCGLCLCAAVCFAGNSVTVCASEAVIAAESKEGRSTNLEWVYKYIDGVLMMRLWNHSTQQWETDWVPAVG